MLNFDSSPFTNNVYKRREKNLYEYLQFVGFRNNNDLRNARLTLEFCETIPIPWRERVSNEGKSWHVRIPSIFLSIPPPSVSIRSIRAANFFPFIRPTSGRTISHRVQLSLPPDFKCLRKVSIKIFYSTWNVSSNSIFPSMWYIFIYLFI